MRIIVLTSDRHIQALRPYAYLLNKYWHPNPQVLVAGFTPPPFPLPDNFSFHSIGKFEDYPKEKWSDGVIKLLNDIADETFVLMLEDYFIVRPVDTRAVEMCDGYCRQFRYVLRIDLTTDRLFSYGPRYPGDVPDYGNLGYLDLVRSDPNLPYHMSMMTAVWRRDNLLGVLVPGESPWQVEIAGTPRASARTDLLVLGTRQWIVRHGLGYRGGDTTRMDVSYLRPEDQDYLREQGWI